MQSNQQFKYSKKVAVLGGGTGQFNLLRGLVKLNDPNLITAIPSSWDSGGSSGRLRTERGVLPPGDARQCLIALMEDPEQQDVALAAFNDRSFDEHSLGNIILAVLDKIYRGQDRALDKARALFHVRAKVTPISLSDVQLIAKTKSGSEIIGEVNIDHRWSEEHYDLADRIERIYFDTKPLPNPEALKAIKEADLIILSSGSLYGSVLPHLLIEEVKKEIQESNGKLVFVLNIMTERGQTENYMASDHLEPVLYYLGDNKRLDYIIASDNNLDTEILKVYRAENQIPVELDTEKCNELAPKAKIIKKPLASYLKDSHLLRHDPLKLASSILDLD